MTPLHPDHFNHQGKDQLRFAIALLHLLPLMGLQAGEQVALLHLPQRKIGAGLALHVIHLQPVGADEHQVVAVDARIRLGSHLLEQPHHQLGQLPGGMQALLSFDLAHAFSWSIKFDAY